MTDSQEAGLYVVCGLLGLTWLLPDDWRAGAGFLFLTAVGVFLAVLLSALRDYGRRAK